MMMDPAFRRRADLTPRQQYYQEKLVMDMPSGMLMELCQILDVDEDNWKKFAAELDFTMLDVENLRRRNSPSTALLTKWAGSRPTVRELYYILKKLQMYWALHVINSSLPSDLQAAPQGPAAAPPAPNYHYGPLLPSPPPSFNQGQDIPKAASLGYQQLPSLPGYEYPDRGQDQYQVGNNSIHQYPRPVAAQYPKTPDGVTVHLQGYNNQPTYGQLYASNPQPVYHSEYRDAGRMHANNTSPTYKDFTHDKLDNVQYQGQGAAARQTMDHFDFDKHRQFLMPDTQSVPSMPSLNYRDRDLRQKIIKMTRWLTYESLQNATDNFDPHQILGEGGFGIVYKGIFEDKKVAVKVMKQPKIPGIDPKQYTEVFLTEVVNLRLYTHENIIPLLGICMGIKNCLVHEYMPCGSLEDRLLCKDGEVPLTWRVRGHILLGASRGLMYLHTHLETPLIHGDIKSANILLDRNMEPRLSDFGQSRQATRSSTTDGYTHVILEKKDSYPLTEAYLPDDVFVNDSVSLGVKTDTFSFGVIIFECCSGLKPVDLKRGHDNRLLRSYVLNLAEDGFSPRLLSQKDPKACDWPDDLFLDMVKLSFKCVDEKPFKRPTMERLYTELESLESRNKEIRSPTFQAPVDSMSNIVPPSVSLAESFRLRYSSDGDGNVNCQNPADQMERLLRAAGRLNTERKEEDEDKEYWMSDPKKLAAIEEFDKFNTTGPAPTWPVGSPVDLCTRPQTSGQNLGTRNEPTELGDDSQPSGLSDFQQNRFLRPPSEEFNGLSLGPPSSSIPYLLQRSYDRSKASSLSTDNNEHQPEELSSDTHSPEVSSTNSQNTYKIHNEHHRKMQKKSLLFVMPPPAGGCTSAEQNELEGKSDFKTPVETESSSGEHPNVGGIPMPRQEQVASENTMRFSDPSNCAVFAEEKSDDAGMKPWEREVPQPRKPRTSSGSTYKMENSTSGGLDSQMAPNPSPSPTEGLNIPSQESDRSDGSSHNQPLPEDLQRIQNYKDMKRLRKSDV